MGKGGNLTEAEARQRALLVADVAYQLDLDLRNPATGSYTALATISFGFKTAGGSSADVCLADGGVTDVRAQDLFLDFASEALVSQVTVNDVFLQDVSKVQDLETARIKLPYMLLAPANVVKVKYTKKYDHDGMGIHLFADPQDRQNYVYTNFEPFDAHKLFPCFDQPSIRATFSLKVATNQPDWIVLSNSPMSQPKPLEMQQAGVPFRLWEFDPTPKISCYLYAIVAGPYDLCASGSFTSKSVTKKEVPLGIYARRSLSHLIKADAEELISITKSGLQFYEDFFGMDYPFAKYDQIFVPEFNMGAMENVGCVTFTETYVFRDRPTPPQRWRRCESILHEMAHMWFGNLVSPVWWSGLWLNESFATYMSFFAMSQIGLEPFSSSAWVCFCAGKKWWGYKADQAASTHPIACEVKDTDTVFQNFDGITYGKGAAVIKQLILLVGDAGFKTGMRHYFTKHAWGNTDINDFLESLRIGAAEAGSCTLDVEKWKNEWLLQASQNTIKASLLPPAAQDASASDEKRASVISFAQAASRSTFPTLRTQKLLVALWDYVGDGQPLSLRPIETAEILPVEETLVTLKNVGEPPSLIMPNHGDHGYAHFRLDSSSQVFALQNLSLVPDPLTRLQLWQFFYEAVPYELSASEFINATIKHAPQETNSRVLQIVLENVTNVAGLFVPRAIQIELTSKLFRTALQIVRASTTDGLTDNELMWARSAVSWSYISKETTLELLELLNKPAGSWIDQGMRWNIVQNCCAWAIEGCREMANKEKERDQTDRGNRSHLTCIASLWDSQTKEEVWQKFLSGPEGASLYEWKASMSGFWCKHQEDILSPYVEKFFAVVRSIYAQKPREYASAFFHNLAPNTQPGGVSFDLAKSLHSSLDPTEHVLARDLGDWIDSQSRYSLVISLCK